MTGHQNTKYAWQAMLAKYGPFQNTNSRNVSCDIRVEKIAKYTLWIVGCDLNIEYKSKGRSTLDLTKKNITENYLNYQPSLFLPFEVHFDELRDPSPGHDQQPPGNPQNVEQETEWDLDHKFSENRVRRALKEFSPLTAAGPDGTRPIMLQKGWEHLKTAYTNIVKASLRLGHTPHAWLDAPHCGGTRLWKFHRRVPPAKPGKTD